LIEGVDELVVEDPVGELVDSDVVLRCSEDEVSEAAFCAVDVVVPTVDPNVTTVEECGFEFDALRELESRFAVIVDDGCLLFPEEV
jgi:hypothetical protein